MDASQIARETPIRIGDAAKLLGVHRRTIEQWFSRGLGRFRIGGTIYTTREEIARFAVVESSDHATPAPSVDPEEQEARQRLRERHGL